MSDGSMIEAVRCLAWATWGFGPSPYEVLPERLHAHIEQAIGISRQDFTYENPAVKTGYDAWCSRGGDE